MGVGSSLASAGTQMDDGSNVIKETGVLRDLIIFIQHRNKAIQRTIHTRVFLLEYGFLMISHNSKAQL